MATFATGVPPNYYIHVLDQNLNLTTLHIGPQTFVKRENEKLVYGPAQMVCLTSFEFCKITNPVAKDDKGAIIFEQGQAKLRYGEDEYRFHQDPFPLYPGEVMSLEVTQLEVVKSNEAIVLSALVDYVDAQGKQRHAGDEWLFEGPATYYPRIEESIKSHRSATIIKTGDALRLRALAQFVDRSENIRKYGEQWLITKAGAYLHGPHEEIVEYTSCIPLDEQNAIWIKALCFHDDCYGKTRKFGDKWLLTYKDAASHTIGVNEELIKKVKAINLTAQQYVVKLNPVDKNGICMLGRKELVRGVCCFFLHPGEELEAGIQDVYILGENDGLILKAIEQTTFDTKSYVPGEKWLITGPVEYVPPVSVEVVSRRSVIPLDETEGIYVRNTSTGKVRAVIGKSYMLNQDEELWEKNLPRIVEELIISEDKPIDASLDNDINSRLCSSTSIKKLDKTKVVTLNVAHNLAVQIYDYKAKASRVVFGPNRIVLGSDEQFTVLSLSGGRPKRPNKIKALCLLLGPSFTSDVIAVETSDHARLSLQLSYNWHFDLYPGRDPDTGVISQAYALKLFSVPDFIGDMCKAIASRIRGSVASIRFDDFHKNSARIIRSSVFGLDETGKVRLRFEFAENNLVVTSIDIQSVEPIDQRTRDALQKSVQLAIEITTNSQEATARHEAERIEQEARGRMERQRISDEVAAEDSRRCLVEFLVTSAALESSGQAKAEASSRAEALRISAEANVELSQMKAEAASIEADSELNRLKLSRDSELSYQEKMNQLCLKRSFDEAKIEVSKFSRMIKSVGTETINCIATAGPEQDVNLLRSLGLSSTLITDGISPINLISTAQGLIGKVMGFENGKNGNQVPHCDTTESPEK